MLKLLSTILFITIFTLSNNLYAQTISSTSTGGLWNSTTTWVGGVVPGVNNDVVINGVVQVNGTFSCRSVTVNSGATLQNSGTQTLTVNGNLVNNGLIRDDYWYFTINITGDITNNGTWTNYLTNLTGTTDQQLFLDSGKTFASLFASADTLGDIVAATPLVFRNGFNLNRSRLNMQSNALTLEASGNIHTGRVINTADLTVRDGAVLSNITYQGSINLKRLVRIGVGVTMEGIVTVTDTLQNSSTQTLTVNGNLVNNGLIQYDYWYFTINITGNITNNGTWTNYLTNLTGTTDQQLFLDSGKTFASLFASTDTLGDIVATTPLVFRNGFNLNRSRLNMQSNALTLEVSGNIHTGRVINTADLTVRDGAILSNITYQGSINLKRLVRIGVGVTMEGIVTVTDTLQNSSTQTLTVNGNLVNNGLIRDDYWRFSINVTGNITNNGTWTNYLTSLTGTTDQQLFLDSGKTFASLFASADTLGDIVAATPLVFRNGFNLNRSRLNMQSNALTLEVSGNIHNGRVINAPDLTVRDGAILSNITYQGSLTLKRLVRIGVGVTMEGIVTVTDTLQNSSTQTLTVNGNLVNNGLIRDDYWRFSINVTGNITNNGTMTLTSVNLTGSGHRTIMARGATSIFTSTGSNVILVGENLLHNLYLASGSNCVVAANGSLRFLNFIILSKNVVNKGKISIPIQMENRLRDYGFFSGIAQIGAGIGVDTLTVETYGYQVPETFANGVRSWWRFIPTPYNTSSSISKLWFFYKEPELGNNDENTLKVFHSSDSGATWRQISTTLNTVRDTVNNWVAITDVPIAGDFILSSNPDPVSVRPSVILSVIGRDQIRVGPPNRYTIHYANNSDVSTGDMIMEIKSQGLVHISKIEPSMPVGVAPQHIPIDSLTYGGDKEQALLWISSMAPREERTFDVIFKAYPDVISKSGEITSPNETKAIPLIAAGLWWAAKGLAVAYVTDATLNMTEEIWRPVAPCETVTEAFKEAVKESFRKTNEEWFGWEKPAKEISKNAAEELLKLKGINLPSTVILDATGKTINGMQRYLQDDFKIKDCEGKDRPPTGDVTKNTKPLQKTMSWDPNEKVAPSGFGDYGFISSAGRMNYRILFENLKAATAPAWRIIIVDTLSDVFDPQSVVFGTTSHEGPQYNWIKTVDGNIVRWEIEDIELPPNVIPPEGEGYVDFSVMTKGELTSGTELRNKAMIVFDYNQPIITNGVVNTLDFLAPVTQMLELPAQVDPPKLTVRWNSADGANGSGVQSVILYASENGGAYIQIGTTDADSFVVSVNPGSNYSFYALGKDNVGNVEQGRPVSVATVVTSVSTGDIEALPKEYSLSQNYPNPFNPSTVISYSLPVNSLVTLKIYNLLGQEVATLVDENKKAGSYRVEFNSAVGGRQLASGVYFYRLVAGDPSTSSGQVYVSTKKFILLK